jgi:two-component system chemotaxis response regulator CheB
MTERLRILIVDDSALVRRAFREMLESDPSIQVVGEAANGREALLQAAELRPDIITMDVRMPVMDGLETTEQLMAYNPTPVLAITALYSRDDVDISFKMLGAGALEVMEKPDISNAEAYERTRREIIRRVKLLARVRVVTHLRGRRRPESTSSESPELWRVKRKRTQTTPTESRAKKAQENASPSAQSQAKKAEENASNDALQSPDFAAKIKRSRDIITLPSVPQHVKPALQKYTNDVVAREMQNIPRRPHLARLRFSVVVIGASTGGPRIVQQILKNLPERFDAAVLVVQHIAEGFSAGMVEWLAESCPLPVRMAAEGDKIKVGEVLVAPDSFHLFVQGEGTVHLDQQPMLQHPSVDITMQTVASVFGSYTTGVLLTGMGRDGAIGMQSIHRVGGYTIAQDEASCSIYGMPRAAVELNAVNEVLSPEGIIQALVKRFGDGG